MVYCDSIFAFALNNNNKYFAGSFRFDQYGKNKISPSCGKLLHTGNVENIVSINSNVTPRQKIFEGDYQSLYPTLDNDIRLPAQYTIINNPIENTIT